jgi:hypothetical protein
MISLSTCVFIAHSTRPGNGGLADAALIVQLITEPNLTHLPPVQFMLYKFL